MVEDILLSDDNFIMEFEDTVKPFLAKTDTDISLKRPDGIDISGHFYKCEGSDRVVFISHGFTEFSERYSEVIYYLVKMGYSVAICDHRGHGYSGRMLDNPCMVHVDNYDTYVEDYKAFADKVCDMFPTNHKFLFGHSMGGCIASLFIEKYPDYFEKCLLSSPMHEPDRGGIPKFAAVGLFKVLIAFGKGEGYLFNADNDYKPTETFEDSCGSEYNRWKVFNDMRISTKAYQTSGGSVRWMYESVKGADKAVKNAGKITIPVLLIQAEKDNMVLPGGHEKFLENCHTAKKYVMKNAKHESFNSCLELRKNYYDQLENFYRD